MGDRDAGSERGGFCRERLARLDRMLASYVETGQVAGVEARLFRRGVPAHVTSIGHRDQAAGIALDHDTIFRIASMTKPITSVAALILLEENLLRLDDPIERWIPELANRRVIRRIDGPLDDSVPAARPITVLDLLTHRAGLASAALNTEGPLGAALQRLSPGLGIRHSGGVDDFLARFGELPLVCQPGTLMNYGFSTDVLGFLIGRVAGQSFPDFVEGRICAPLRLRDTGFWVPAAKLPRLAVCDAYDPATGRRTVTDHPQRSNWAAPPAVPSGAGGMVSTGIDFERFGRMLLGMGKLDGTRILSRKSVELMIADRMPPEVRAQRFFGFDFWSEKGFGLGVWVRDRTGVQTGLGSPGSYGWGGAFGTWWFNDPAEDLTAVLMIQTFFPDPTPMIHRDFRNAVYQAIDD